MIRIEVHCRLGRNITAECDELPRISENLATQTLAMFHVMLSLSIDTGGLANVKARDSR